MAILASQNVLRTSGRSSRRQKKGISVMTAVFGSVVFLLLDTQLFPYLFGDQHVPLTADFYIKKNNSRREQKMRTIYLNENSVTNPIPQTGELLVEEHHTARTSTSPGSSSTTAADVKNDVKEQVLGAQQEYNDDINANSGAPSLFNIASSFGKNGKNAAITLEEEELEVSGNVYVLEIAVVIILSLLFEYCEDMLRENLARKEKEVALDILDSCFGELTVLGFIGLAVFISTKTGAATRLAERLVPGYDGEGENPLSESFENVHMCIFCVMMVFMFQAATLMYIAEDLDRVWDRWESMSPKGRSNSIEAVLKRAGYVDRDGNRVQSFSPGTFRERMWHQKSHKMMVLWHGLRHLFCYPVAIDEDENHLSDIVEVKDPASFDFRMYLSSKMGQLLTDLVEVDNRTWLFALVVVVPFVSVATTVSPVVIMVMQTVMGLIFSCIFAWLLSDLTRVEYNLCPQLGADAPEWLEYMAEKEFNTMNNADKKGRKIVAMGVTRESQAPGAEHMAKGGLLNGDGMSAELRERLLFKESTTLASLMAPVHFRILERRSELEKKQMESSSKDEYLEKVAEEMGENKRPLHVRLLGGKEDYIPHEHDRLFHFHEFGVGVCNQIMRTMMFMEAILVASLLVVLVVFPKGPVGWGLFIFSMLQWPFQLLVLLPKIITKYCIVSSIECYKDHELINKVTLSVKERRLREAVSLMQMVKLRGRIERLGGHRLSKQKFDELSEKFDHFSEDKQRHIEKAFVHMDFDHSGQIGVEELEKLMSSMNILANSDVHKNAKQLVHMVDMDKDGMVDLTEFKVLMALAYEKQDPMEEIQDFDKFFDLIDVDMDEALAFQELAQFCRDNFAIPMNNADIGELVYRCFRTVKAELTRDDFIVWMRWLQDCEKGQMSEDAMRVDRGFGSGSDLDTPDENVDQSAKGFDHGIQAPLHGHHKSSDFDADGVRTSKHRDDPREASTDEDILEEDADETQRRRTSNSFFWRSSDAPVVGTGENAPASKSHRKSTRLNKRESVGNGAAVNINDAVVVPVARGGASQQTPSSTGKKRQSQHRSSGFYSIDNKPVYMTNESNQMVSMLTQNSVEPVRLEMSTAPATNNADSTTMLKNSSKTVPLLANQQQTVVVDEQEATCANNKPPKRRESTSRRLSTKANTANSPAMLARGDTQQGLPVPPSWQREQEMQAEKKARLLLMGKSEVPGNLEGEFV